MAQSGVNPAWDLVSGGIGSIANVYGGKQAQKAQRYATDAAVAAQNRAADLEAKSAQDALAFAREQETARQKEWQSTQDRNYALWLQQRRDLSPYRRLGTGAIGQLAMPIPRTPTDRPDPNTLAGLVGR